MEILFSLREEERKQQRRCKWKVNFIEINFCVPKATSWEEVQHRFFLLLKKRKENELKSFSNFYDFSSKNPITRVCYLGC